MNSLENHLLAENPLAIKNKNEPKDGPSGLPKTRICINLTHCVYDIVKHTCEKLLNWRVIKYDEENLNCDVIWNDAFSNEELLAKIKPYQRLNHFPGICTIGRKNFLAIHLNKMKKEFPLFYDFFPKTYCLPTEKNLVRKVFDEKKPNDVYIIKPDASSRGRGIFLTRRIEDVPFTENFIVQKYIKSPFLIDGLKFDMRIYVVITSVDPLKIYIYKDGLARFATEEYLPPTGSNLNNMFQHLTNYAINKNSKNFQFCKDPEYAETGHKRSLRSIWTYLDKKGIDSKLIWASMGKNIVKTICSIQPILKQIYKSSRPDDFHGGSCFQLLGFDIILTSKLKTKVLEVNHAPSLNSDTPFDFKMKSEMLKNMFELIECSVEVRNNISEKAKNMFEGKFKNGVRSKFGFEEKEKVKQLYLIEQEKRLPKVIGSFERIYPIDNPSEPYKEFMKYAEFMQTKKMGVEKVKERKIEEKQKIRSTSSIQKCVLREKENENMNKMVARLHQKEKLEKIQETVNRLYNRKNIEIKEAQENKIIRQNLQVQSYFERMEKIKTNVINLDFGSFSVGKL